MKSACYVASRLYGSHMESAEVVSFMALVKILDRLGIGSTKGNAEGLYRRYYKWGVSVARGYAISKSK